MDAFFNGRGSSNPTSINSDEELSTVKKRRIEDLVQSSTRCTLFETNGSSGRQ